MAERTTIEWTDATWNPTRGCSRVSPGCVNCYAEGIAARFSKPGQAFAGLATFKDKKARWTGEVRFIKEKLTEPLDWKEPRRVFVDSMSDLFHAKIFEPLLDQVFAVMALADHHIMQVLTKRVARMCAYTNSAGATRPTESLLARVAGWAKIIAESRGEDTSSPYFDVWLEDWPLKHIWLGASAEDQNTYNERRENLEKTDASVIWWSLEPLLGPIDLQLWKSKRLPDWIVCGGESGANARAALHPDYVRRIRDECVKHKIPFFFKQWGSWVTLDQNLEAFEATGPNFRHDYVKDETHDPGCPNRAVMVFRTGKKFAGRKLDGEEWNQYPISK
jgi:protein gp37